VAQQGHAAQQSDAASYAAVIRSADLGLSLSSYIRQLLPMLDSPHRSSIKPHELDGFHPNRADRTREDALRWFRTVATCAGSGATFTVPWPDARRP
jgi:hypothetical protein